MISPTVSRKVWYRPSQNDLCVGTEITPPMIAVGDQAFDATVVYVHSDTCVNLVIRDHIGTQFRRTSVILSQGNNPVPDGAAYAEWMPYQQGQAKKEAETAATPFVDPIAVRHTALMFAKDCANGDGIVGMAKQFESFLLGGPVPDGATGSTGSRSIGSIFGLPQATGPQGEWSETEPLQGQNEADMRAYQQRVVFERCDLAVKIVDLCKFNDSDRYAQLDKAERDRLRYQLQIMRGYLNVLTERIAAFR